MAERVIQLNVSPRLYWKTSRNPSNAPQQATFYATNAGKIGVNNITGSIVLRALPIDEHDSGEHIVYAWNVDIGVTAPQKPAVDRSLRVPDLSKNGTADTPDRCEDAIRNAIVEMLKAWSVYCDKQYTWTHQVRRADQVLEDFVRDANRREEN